MKPADGSEEWQYPEYLNHGIKQEDCIVVCKSGQSSLSPNVGDVLNKACHDEPTKNKTLQDYYCFSQQEILQSRGCLSLNDTVCDTQHTCLQFMLPLFQHSTLHLSLSC